MATLRHPNVSVHDVGVADDRFFIVMELVEGGTLGAWLKAEARSWRDIVPLFLQAGHDRDWISAPMASPDGRRVAIETRQDAQNLWLLSGL